MTRLDMVVVEEGEGVGGDLRYTARRFPLGFIIFVAGQK